MGNESAGAATTNKDYTLALVLSNDAVIYTTQKGVKSRGSNNQEELSITGVMHINNHTIHGRHLVEAKDVITVTKLGNDYIADEPENEEATTDQLIDMLIDSLQEAMKESKIEVRAHKIVPRDGQSFQDAIEERMAQIRKEREEKK